MKLLLDTHAFLWFIMGDPRLSVAARSAIEDPANEKFVSAASAWEIAIKVSLGKLHLNEAFDTLLPREIARNGFRFLSIELSHTAALVPMPLHHRDPFDRLLVAQAMVEQLELVSADQPLDQYGVRRLW